MVDSDVIPILAISLVFGIPIVAIVGHYGHRAWKAWLELNLKREMVARGYTAQEIVEVLGAKSGGRCQWPADLPARSGQRQAVV
jgi:hypothetical protein